MKECNAMPKRLAALAAAGAILCTLAAGCSAPNEAPQSEEPGTKAIEVAVTSPDFGTIDRQTEFVGRVEAGLSTKVYPTSGGKVIKTYAAAGEHVSKGDLLFELDTENLETAVESARLQYEAAVAGADTSIISAKQRYDSAGDAFKTAKEKRDDIEDAYDNTKRKMNEAQKALDAAKAEETPDEEKIAELEEALAKAQAAFGEAKYSYDLYYDTLEDSVDSARKNLVIARDTYKNTKGDEEEGVTGTVQSQVDLAKISYDNAVKALNEAKVYAPVSGIVSTKNVSPTDMASPQSPAYIIDQDEAAPQVSFNLSEDGANALAVGSAVTVVYNGKEYSAKVTEISNAANPQTGLYAAKASTDEPLDTTRSGGVVKVKASTAKAENTMVLPLELLEYDGNQPYVYVYRDGVAVRADVTTGISSAEEVVILEGLSAEDQIITTWHPDLKDGAAVTLKDQQEKGE